MYIGTNAQVLFLANGITPFPLRLQLPYFRNSDVRNILHKSFRLSHIISFAERNMQ